MGDCEGTVIDLRTALTETQSEIIALKRQVELYEQSLRICKELIFKLTTRQNTVENFLTNLEKQLINDAMELRRFRDEKY